MTDDFVHLHTHSDAGSLLDGFGQLSEYIKRVTELNQPGLGISDHGSTAAVYTLIQKARSAGIIPVPGCEFYVAPQNPEGAKVRNAVFYGPNGQKAAEYDVSSNGAYTHQTIWAVNNVGLSNLFKLSTLSNDPERYYSKPRIDFEMLAEHSEGLVVATGCPSSEVSTRFLLNQDKQAYEYANRLKEVFGDRLFVEIMDHNMDIDLERRLLPKLMGLARKMKLPLLATNDAHYTLASENIHHEEMLCSQSGSRMNEPTWDEGGSRFAFNGNQYYLKTAAEMATVFPAEDYPGALSNTLLIAEMAQDINMTYDPSLRPKAIVPEGYNEVSYFRHLIEVGFKERYGSASPEVKREAQSRIKTEFEVIHSSDFIGYFLTVHEYINWTRDSFSLLDEAGKVLALPIGVGRGSVGGSIIAYLLKISELDPIKHDLLFERFLSAGRGDTYEIVYEDGTREEVVVSAKRVVKGEKDEARYIHQLAPGDVVVLDAEPEAAPGASSLQAPVVAEPAPVETAEPAEAPVPVTLNTKSTLPPSPFLERPRVLPVPTPEELSDLTEIPF